VTFPHKSVKVDRPIIDAPTTQEQEDFLADLAAIREAATIMCHASEHVWHRVPA